MNLRIRPLAVAVSLDQNRHRSRASRAAWMTLASGPMLMLGVSLVHAASQLDVVVGARVEHHDNVSLESGNERSDLDRVARLDVGYTLDGEGVRIDLGYDAEYHDYLHDHEEDETAINGRTNLVWELIPRSLDLILNHQVSQERSDRRGADVSSNREMRSIVTAGLDWTSRLSAVDSLVVRPRFADIRFEESDESDSQQGSLVAGWQRQLSPVSQMSLLGTYTDARFDDGQNDYTATSLLLGYTTALARLGYRVEIGANQFDRDRGDKIDGFVVRANLSYDGGATQWSGALVHELTDSSIGLSGQDLAQGGFIADDGNFDQFDIVERTQLDLGVQHRFNAVHSAGASIGARNDDYEDTLRDERGYFATANYNYTLNSFWSFGVDIRAAHTDFVDDPLDLDYDETFYRGFVDYRHSRALTAQFALVREERDASVRDFSYTDNVVLFSVSYQLF